MRFYYGMRLRGVAPGCQPKEGFVDWHEDSSGKYWNIIIYSRPLTDRECFEFDLDWIKNEK